MRSSHAQLVTCVPRNHQRQPIQCQIKQRIKISLIKRTSEGLNFVYLSICPSKVISQ